MTGPYAAGAFVAEEHQHAIGVGAECTDRARTAPDLRSGPSAPGFGGRKSWVVRLTNSITLKLTIGIIEICHRYIPRLQWLDVVCGDRTP